MGVEGWADWGVGLGRDGYACLAETKGESFRPPAEGELLSLAWPRESSQREGHPTWRLPGYARQVREPWPGFSTGLLP